MNTKNFLVPLSIGVMILAGASRSAHASYFDDSVQPVEIAEAMARCAEEAKQLFPSGAEYMDEVTVQHAKTSSGADLKTYSFKTYVAGNIFGPPRQLVASLDVTVTLTQADPRRADSRNTVTWSCNLSK